MRDTVLIVGAGPTGLVLALWLTRQGIKVRIVDKTAGPGTTSRAMAVQARTLELYRQLDLAEAVVEAGHITPAINLWTGGARRAHLQFDDVGKDLTPYSFVLVYPQDRHEKLLVDRLSAVGVEVERRTECLGFEDFGDHISARLKGPDGVEQTVEAAFIAGCDGAHSVVRHGIGAGFPGAAYDKIFYVADVKAGGGATAGGEAHIALDKADFVLWLPYSDQGEGRLIGAVSSVAGAGADPAKPLTFDDVGREAIASVGVTVEKVNWFSTYHVHHRVADPYRKDRAFLLGDAAHIHSPAGGQGMNTGIGDAINLAWKLAAVLRDGAHDSLLDSYEAERRAFALRLVATTDRLFSFVTADSGFADFVRTRVVPIIAPTAFGFHDVREFMFRTVSQTLISYHDGPISQGQAGHVRGGDRLPWVRQDDNYASLSHVGWQVHVYGEVDDSVERWCAARDMPLHRFAFGPPHEAAGLARNAAYLIRPDSYVACADPDGRASTLQAYMGRNIVRPPAA